MEEGRTALGVLRQPFASSYDRRQPIVGAELEQKVLDVLVDRFDDAAQIRCDFGVPLALCDTGDHVAFASSQSQFAEPGEFSPRWCHRLVAAPGAISESFEMRPQQLLQKLFIVWQRT